MEIKKEIILRVLAQSGFENWQPSFHIRHLNRPRTRPAELEGDGRQGAVLLMLYRNQEDKTPPPTRLVLTRRHEKLNNHGGQISLPGGQRDQHETLEQTALRETREEIGIESTEIEILGQLNQVYIPPSDFTVIPFVGWYRRVPEFVMAKNEVAEIIEASLSELLKPATLTHGPIQFDGTERDVPYYRVGNHRVWGATAIILNEFLLRIQAVIGTNNHS